MVMLKLKKLTLRRRPRMSLQRSVHDEIASMRRTDALEAYVCGKRSDGTDGG